MRMRLLGYNKTNNNINCFFFSYSNYKIEKKTYNLENYILSIHETLSYKKNCDTIVVRGMKTDLFELNYNHSSLENPVYKYDINILNCLSQDQQKQFYERNIDSETKFLFDNNITIGDIYEIKEDKIIYKWKGKKCEPIILVCITNKFYIIDMNCKFYEEFNEIETFLSNNYYDIVFFCNCQEKDLPNLIKKHPDLEKNFNILDFVNINAWICNLTDFVSLEKFIMVNYPEEKFKRGYYNVVFCNMLPILEILTRLLNKKMSDICKMRFHEICDLYLIRQMRNQNYAIVSKINTKYYKIINEKVETPYQHYIGGKVNVHRSGIFAGKFKRFFNSNNLSDLVHQSDIKEQFLLYEKSVCFDNFDVCSADAISMYPSIIIHFKLDPFNVFNNPQCIYCLPILTDVKKEYLNLHVDQFRVLCNITNDNVIPDLTEHINICCRKISTIIEENTEIFYVCQKKKGFFVNAIKLLYDIKISSNSNPEQKMFFKKMVNTCYGWLNMKNSRISQNTFEVASIITSIGRKIITEAELFINKFGILTTTDTDGTIFLLPISFPGKFQRFQFVEEILNQYIQKYVYTGMNHCNDVIKFKVQKLGDLLIIPAQDNKKQYIIFDSCKHNINKTGITKCINLYRPSDNTCLLNAKKMFLNFISNSYDCATSLNEFYHNLSKIKINLNDNSTYKFYMNFIKLNLKNNIF